MPRFNMLLATIILCVLLLSEQQQLLVKAYSGGNAHDDVEKSQLYVKQQQYKQQQLQQQQQRFTHHGRHHHNHHQQQQQQHHQQAISESAGTKFTPTTTKQQQQQSSYKQQQQQQQHVAWNHSPHFGNIFSKYKNKPKDPAEPTSKPTTAIKESQEQLLQQQQQTHYQQQHHQHHHHHQQQQAEHPHHYHHHLHHSPTAKPIVATHSSSSLSSAHSTSSLSPSLSSETYAHNHSKTWPLKHSTNTDDVIATSFHSGMPKSMSLESSYQQHFKAKTHNHRLEDLAVNKHHQLKTRKKSSDLDYANDYYYDDEEDNADDGDYDDDNDSDLDETREDEYSSDATGFSDRDDHEYNRVPRDHRHSNRLDGDDRKTNDQDYADDEPYRSSSAEQFQGDAAAAAGTLTEQKFRELGTMEAVQQSRDKYLQEQELLRQRSPVELAREHMNRMKTATRCSRPMPRVVHVSNETSKRYIPHCTILHRCGQDTGCCDSTRQVCAMRNYTDVQVYFFVIKINSGTNRRETEVKTLRNHTECHCVDIAANNMQRDKRSGYSLRPQQAAASYVEQEQEDDAAAAAAADAANDICRCPRHFDVFPDDAEPQGYLTAASVAAAAMHPRNCRCDCLSNNMPCQRLKNGDEGFAVDDRKCIAERNCKTPICAYGDYSRHTGRCPRLRTHKRTISHHNYGFG